MHVKTRIAIAIPYTSTITSTTKTDTNTYLGALVGDINLLLGGGGGSEESETETDDAHGDSNTYVKIESFSGGSSRFSERLNASLVTTMENEWGSMTKIFSPLRISDNKCVLNYGRWRLA
jgi:hypothetical protein